MKLDFFSARSSKTCIMFYYFGISKEKVFTHKTRNEKKKYFNVWTDSSTTYPFMFDINVVFIFYNVKNVSPLQESIVFYLNKKRKIFYTRSNIVYFMGI